MKRTLLVILAMMIFLCGCAGTGGQETTQPPVTTAETTLPEPTSLYAPEDPAEQESAGAVKAYLLERSGAQGLAMLNGKLLVFLEAGGTELILIDPQAGTIEQTFHLSCSVQPNTQAVQIGAQGLGYYDEGNRVVILMDAALRETARIQLPENILGEPVIAPTLDQIYYCIPNEIRVIDVKTGISRLLRQQENGWNTLTQLYFDGQILAYPTLADGDRLYTTYMDTATGSVINTAEGICWIETYEDRYILQYTDEDVSIDELLFANKGEQLRKLNFRSGEAWPVLNIGAVVTADAREGLLLEHYDLNSGLRTAEVSISGEKSPVDILAQQEGVIWVLAYDAQRQQNVLYRWETAASIVTDETVYVGPWYTAQSPDEETLAQCQAEADAIGDKYGVDIRIGRYALEVPCDYTMEEEFHPEIFRQKLQVIDAALAKFPEDFLKKIGKVSKSGEFHICLVRSVADGITGVQFWNEGEAYAAVQLNGDLEYNLYLELYHIIDTYVFNRTSTLDTWDWLNPKGFSYFESYVYSADQVDSKFLEGETRAFVTELGMTYPREDRAEFFAAAMTDGHKEVFSSETMQEKLTSLGKGIRNAFNWKKDERSFTWEQYLDTPLAYTKKK